MFYDSLRTTVIKDETISEGKMDIFPNMEKENLPMKIPLLTGKCLRELCLSLSGSSVIINYKSYYLLAFPRPTKEFTLYVILFLALLHDGEGPLLYCIGRSQAGFMQYLSTFYFLGKKVFTGTKLYSNSLFKIKKKLILTLLIYKEKYMIYSFS